AGARGLEPLGAPCRRGPWLAETATACPAPEVPRQPARACFPLRNGPVPATVALRGVASGPPARHGCGCYWVAQEGGVRRPVRPSRRPGGCGMCHPSLAAPAKVWSSVFCWTAARRVREGGGAAGGVPACGPAGVTDPGLGTPGVGTG